MSAIPDDRLFSHSDRVKGKVVLITGLFQVCFSGLLHLIYICYEQSGAAKGIGKETALCFALYGLAQRSDGNVSGLNIDIVPKWSLLTWTSRALMKWWLKSRRLAGSSTAPSLYLLKY